MDSYYSTTCFPTFGIYKNIFPYIKLTRSHNTIHLAHRRRSSIEKYSRWPCHQVLRYNALEDQISMAQARLLLTIPNWVLGIAIQPALLKETWATKLFQNPIEKKKKGANRSNVMLREGSGTDDGSSSSSCCCRLSARPCTQRKKRVKPLLLSHESTATTPLFITHAQFNFFHLLGGSVAGWIFF